jgi:hypothetical protein
MDKKGKVLQKLACEKQEFTLTIRPIENKLILY